MAIASPDLSTQTWEFSEANFSGSKIVGPTERIFHQGRINAVAIAPDGAFVATPSTDGTARVWDAKSGRELARMTHDGAVFTVAFSPHAKHPVTGGEDGVVRLWERNALANSRIPS
jgi:WD40 repeat protein